MAVEEVALWPERDVGMARADKGAVGGEQQRAAAVSKAAAVPIKVGPGDRTAAAHADLVGALHASAADAVVEKEEEPAVAFDDVCCFNLSAPGQRYRRRLRIKPQAGRWIELDQLQAAPEGAVGHPELARVGLNDGGVDRVKVVGGCRLNHDALVGPAVVVALGVQRRGDRLVWPSQKLMSRFAVSG